AEHLWLVGVIERGIQIAEDFGDRKSRDTNLCAGIVSYADLRTGDALAETLEAHIEAGKGRFRGIRQITCWSPNDPELNWPRFQSSPGMMADPAFRAGLAR